MSHFKEGSDMFELFSKGSCACSDADRSRLVRLIGPLVIVFFFQHSLASSSVSKQPIPTPCSDMKDYSLKICQCLYTRSQDQNDEMIRKTFKEMKGKISSEQRHMKSTLLKWTQETIVDCRKILTVSQKIDTDLKRPTPIQKETPKMVESIPSAQSPDSQKKEPDRKNLADPKQNSNVKPKSLPITPETALTAEEREWAETFQKANP